MLVNLLKSIGRGFFLFFFFFKKQTTDFYKHLLEPSFILCLPEIIWIPGFLKLLIYGLYKLSKFEQFRDPI